MEKHYRVVIADPAWSYNNPNALVGTGGRGATENCSSIIQVNANQHYETMTVDAIKALPVSRIAAADCLLFMWVTNPFLADGTGVEVVKAWGFKPITILTWAKIKVGVNPDEDQIEPSMKTGHWFRSASEHVIFGIRGNVRRPSGFPAFPTWHPNRRLPHSVKPKWIHEIAEQASQGPYLEMFARSRRPGWDVWGNQVEGSICLSLAK